MSPELKEVAELVNLLLVPALGYLVKLTRTLTRFVTLMEAHEKSDKEKFDSLFRFKEEMDRRAYDRRAGVPDV